jgi:hypothetical protein
MATKRDATLALALGVAAFAVTGAKAGVEIIVTEADALSALNPWADALFSGDPAQVEKVLAPEYQILRFDGSGLDRAGYLKALPQQKKRSQFSAIVATAGGDIMVIRYMLDTDQVINGQTVQGVSPRLSVFRKIGSNWLISAHVAFPTPS